MQLIDSHAHIQEDLFPGEVDQVIQRAKEAGLTAIISIGTSLAESQEMLNLAKKYPNYIFPTVGLHPEDAAHEIASMSLPQLTEAFHTLASQPGVVGIGECGLDYGKPTDPQLTDEQKEVQKQVFLIQVQVAQEMNLPLVVHCRNAWDDTFALLASLAITSPVILHSFTGNQAVAEEAVKRGWYVSFSGIVTFSNAQEIQQAAATIPLTNILIETDSPFLSPVPVRGTRNEPKNIHYTAEYLATLKKVVLEEVVKYTEENTKKVFNLPL